MKEFTPPWDIHKALVVYRDERYTLGQQADRPYLIANGEKYILSCHPYDPCLFIDAGQGSKTAVHNAFDPFVVLECFHDGRMITSITGFEYDAKDFCQMVEYAAGKLKTKGMERRDAHALIHTGRHLYKSVSDRNGSYDIVLDEDYALLCPWADVQKTGELWDPKLTDLAVAVFESEKPNREQRLKELKNR